MERSKRRSVNESEGFCHSSGHLPKPPLSSNLLKDAATSQPLHLPVSKQTPKESIKWLVILLDSPTLIQSFHLIYFKMPIQSCLLPLNGYSSLATVPFISTLPPQKPSSIIFIVPWILMIYSPLISTSLPAFSLFLRTFPALSIFLLTYSSTYSVTCWVCRTQNSWTASTSEGTRYTAGR